MHNSFKVFGAALFAAAMATGSVCARAADAYRLTGPVTYDSLSVYFVRGEGSGGAAPLTLEQAQAQGAIKIHEADTHPAMVENLSGQSVFIQLGDLIKGGLQDQVAGTTLVLPPHSGLTSLATFCVDPFRSSARDGDDPKLFSPVGALIPSRLAKLSVLSGSADSGAYGRIREQSVWWSIDSMRAGLSQRLGGTLETPRTVRWDERPDSRANVLLAARRGGWTTSLPLALEDPRLAQAQQPFMRALQPAGTQQDVIGAVFAIDGRIVGAEIYQSHALLRALWPKLVRAFATEALAAPDAGSQPPPSTQEVSAFLASAQDPESRHRSLGEQGRLTDSEAAIFVETAARDGKWVHRSYVAKVDPALLPSAPEAILVQMLETGQFDGRSIASLGNRETALLQSDPESGTWSATIPSAGDPRMSALYRGEPDIFGGWAATILQNVMALGLLIFLANMLWRELVKPAARRSLAMLARAARFTAQLARDTASRALQTMRTALLPRAIADRRRAYAVVRRTPTLRTAPLS